MPQSPLNVEPPRLGAGLGHARSGVIVEDAEGLVVAANPAFGQLWQLEDAPALLVGRAAAEVGRPPASRLDEPEQARRILDEIAAAQVAVFGAILRRVDGAIIEVDYVPSRMGERYGGCTWIYRAATDLLRADEMRTHNRDLEQRMVDRTQELARANFELQASLRRLNQTQEQLIHAGKMAAVGALVAGLSHELNNPLGIIVGYAQGLLRRTPPDSPGREALVAIERQAQRSAHLVRSLLDFSRNTRSAPQEIALPPLVDRVLELAAGQARRNRIEIRWSPRGPLPPLVSRPQDIESALMNLVSNGIDATPPGGSVTIMAAPAARGTQAGLEISVTDTGIGIPQSVLPRIFDPFFTTKPVGKGTGIGLALTRQAVESLAGRIEVRSAEGIGTTMRIWLPLVPPVGSSASAAPLVPDLTSPAPTALTRARANGGDSP